MKTYKQKEQKKQKAPQGYYLYNDGFSFWGVNLVHYGEVGMPISKKLHSLKKKTKLKWLDKERKR